MRNAKFVGFLQAQGLIPGGMTAPDRRHKDCYVVHRAISGSRTMKRPRRRRRNRSATSSCRASAHHQRQRPTMANQTRQSGQRRRKNSGSAGKPQIRGTAVSMMTASGLKPYDCPISITGEIRDPNRQAPRPCRMADRENLRRRRPRQISDAPSATRSKPPTADTPAETARESSPTTAASSTGN